jgi:hypothetical protein
MLSDSTERDGFLAGIREISEGRTRPFSEIKAALKDRYGEIPEAAKDK